MKFITCYSSWFHELLLVLVPRKKSFLFVPRKEKLLDRFRDEVFPQHVPAPPPNPDMNRSRP
jgi:hypothetical protein